MHIRYAYDMSNLGVGIMLGFESMLHSISHVWILFTIYIILLWFCTGPPINGLWDYSTYINIIDLKILKIFLNILN